MFWGVSKNDQVKLRARFGWRWCHRRPRAPRPGPAAADQHRGQTPPPTGTAARPSGPSGALRAGGGGGFALHEAFRGRVVGVSDPRVVQFPPFGGGKATA